MAEQRKRILVVDDDPDMLLSIRDRLESFGYKVATVSNGSDAVEQMRRGGYAMVFMDINTGKMDGIEALREIGRIAPQTPVIMITANPHRVPAALEAGAKAYLVKPIDKVRLKALAEQWTEATTFLADI